MILESRRAGGRIIMSLAAITAASMLYITTLGVYYSDRLTVFIIVLFGVLFAGGWAALIVNIVIFFRVGQNGSRNDARVFSVEHDAPAEVRLISRNPETPTRLTVAGQALSMRRWRKLGPTLAAHNWHFIRDNVAEAGTFTSITKNWPTIRDEFIRLEWVENSYVTDLGKEAMSNETPPTLD